MTGQRACELASLWEGEQRVITVGQRSVLLLRLGGAVHAYANRCAHQQHSLERAHLEDGVLTCPAHGWQFDACTGQGVNPRGVALEGLPLRIVGGDIWIDCDGAEAKP